MTAGVVVEAIITIERIEFPPNPWWMDLALVIELPWEGSTSILRDASKMGNDQSPKGS